MQRGGQRRLRLTPYDIEPANAYSSRDGDAKHVLLSQSQDMAPNCHRSEYSLDEMTQGQTLEPGLIETLAAGVAHEVRNPLNSVQINLSILEQELKELLPDRQAHVFAVLAKIAGEIKRLDDFVSEFLRFARPPRLNVEHLAVRPLLTDLAAFITPECSKKGVSLALDLAGPDTAWVDGFQLKQAILNLVLNALQATQAAGHIVVRTAGDKRRLVVAVRDDGEGMGAETRQKAFDPFFTTREEGTGLGLPLVRRIAEQHGGSVEIASTPAEGTTVTLVLPAPGA